MARSFNGNTDFIDVGNSATLNPSTITVAGWGMVTGDNNAFGFDDRNTIIARDDNTLGRSFTLQFQGPSANQAIFQVNGGAGATKAFTYTKNVWYHIAGTCGAGGTNVWVNGVVGTSDTPTSAASTTGDTIIGERNYTSFQDRFFGALADVAMWNVVLSSSDIATLAAGLRPTYVQNANLVGWWPLDGYASPETDLSGNGNNGTLTGTSRVLGPPQLWRLSA